MGIIKDFLSAISSLIDTIISGTQSVISFAQSAVAIIRSYLALFPPGVGALILLVLTLSVLYLILGR